MARAMRARRFEFWRLAIGDGEQNVHALNVSHDLGVNCRSSSLLTGVMTEEDIGHSQRKQARPLAPVDQTPRTETEQ